MGPLAELVSDRAPAGTVSVSAADLALQPRCMARTTAHAIAMSRRNGVEGANGNLKRNFTNVDRDYVRTFGTMVVAFVFAFTIAGLNVSLARSFRRLRRAEEERVSVPKSRKTRRPRTFEEVLGPAFPLAGAADATDAAGRAAP